MARTTGKEVAEKVSDFVNSAFGSERVDFVETVVSDHRTLQQDMFKMFLGCIQEWAVAHDNDRYDARNEYTVKASKVMMEALKKEGLY